MITKTRPTFIENARVLLRLAGPLILGQVAVVGMTVTDIYMAGQVSSDTLAALQLGGSIWSMINLVVIGIMIGNSPIIGNYWGPDSLSGCASSFSRRSGWRCQWVYSPVLLFYLGCNY